MSNLARLRLEIGKRDRYPMAKLYGFVLTDVGEGFATITATPGAQFNNMMGRTHGGYAATILDSAMGTAIATRVADDAGFGTIDLKVTYVRKIDADVGELRATANVLHAGRTLLTAEAKLVDGAGKLYAHCTGSFLVYPKQ
jgi:acyl-CoA thioesterase